MQTYDLRKNGYYGFDKAEISEDPLLSFVAQRLGVEEGPLEVQASSKEEAFRLFFGFPYEAEDGSDAGYCNLDDGLRDLMNFEFFEYGYSTEKFGGGDQYVILSDEVW